jgi:hypothetical protein
MASFGVLIGNFWGGLIGILAPKKYVGRVWSCLVCEWPGGSFFWGRFVVRGQIFFSQWGKRFTGIGH